MAKLPDPFPSLLARIKRLEDLVNRIINGSAFSGTPIRPQADGSVQSDDFDGNLDNDDAGTKGWALSSLKAAFGELILRPGSIGNDSLTEPLRVARLHDAAQGFAVTPGAGAQILSASVAVPAGFSQALVLTATVALTAFNDTAATDFLYANVTFSGGTGDGGAWQIGSVDIDAGSTGVAYQVGSNHLTGLTGGTLTVTGSVSSAFGTWSADPSNVGNLDAAVIFLR